VRLLVRLLLLPPRRLLRLLGLLLRERRLHLGVFFSGARGTQLPPQLRLVGPAACQAVQVGAAAARRAVRVQPTAQVLACGGHGAW
jgi:hypothetical protein